MMDTISAHARTFMQVRKNDFSEIMGSIRLFGTTYLEKVHMYANYWLFSALSS